MRWIHQAGVDDFDAMTDVAKALRERLAREAAIAAPPRAARHDRAGRHPQVAARRRHRATRSRPCSSPSRAAARCASRRRRAARSRARSARPATRASTATSTADEIIGQLWLANRLLAREQRRRAADHERRDDGHGRAARELRQRRGAMQLMLDDYAYGLSRRRVTLSTSGLVPGIDRLRERCPVALAVSLHAPNDALRDELVPINRKYPIRELLAACVRYIEKAPRDFVMFEYVLLDGRERQRPRRRASWRRSCADVPCKINLIPFNPFPGTRLRALQPRGGGALPRHADAGGSHRRPCARRAATTSPPRAGSSRARCRTGPGARQRRRQRGGGMTGRGARLGMRRSLSRALACCGLRRADSGGQRDAALKPTARDGRGDRGPRCARACTPSSRRATSSWATCRSRSRKSRKRCAPTRTTVRPTTSRDWCTAQLKEDRLAEESFRRAHRRSTRSIPMPTTTTASSCASASARRRG